MLDIQKIAAKFVNRNERRQFFSVTIKNYILEGSVSHINCVLASFLTSQLICSQITNFGNFWFTHLPRGYIKPLHLLFFLAVFLDLALKDHMHSNYVNGRDTGRNQKGVWQGHNLVQRCRKTQSEG